MNTGSPIGLLLALTYSAVTVTAVIDLTVPARDFVYNVVAREITLQVEDR